MRNSIWGFFALLALVGCGRDGSAPSMGGQDQIKSNQPAVNEREAVKAWDTFIALAKSRKKLVQSSWEQKYEKGRLFVDVLRDEVKLDATRGVMVGEVQVKMDEFSLVSYENRLPDGSFGKGRGSVCEYSLRFRYSGVSWQFVDGTLKGTDIHDKSDVNTSSVPNLSELRYFHLKELFQQ